MTERSYKDVYVGRRDV